ncbi:MAG: pitrilysin family protein [Polaribacter sp.]|nr:pitrilysin family protein [Polaribacter sp.]
MKTKILSLLVIFLLSSATNAQIDRSKMPKPGPDPVVKLGTPKTFTLKNGLKVIMVVNNKLPRASANLTIDNKPYFKGEISGVSGMMGSLLGRGTSNISKDDFNEKIDFLGANVSFFNTGAFASSLKKYFPEILGLMADGVMNSKFTQEEFDKEVQITLDGIKSDEKNVTSAARRVENVLTYGKNHPFGEFTSKESVEKITLQDVKNNYTTYYKPNNAYLVIEGDINPKKIKKLVKSLFSDWKKGEIPVYKMPETQNVATTEINFVNMDNAVQSEITVINNIDLTLGDKDYYAALIANNILGGGGTARLFMNLREDKGYTYGSYSRLSQNRYAGTFRATASVRNAVTDSSVVEIQKEINKIRYKKVTAEELANSKEEYIGGFVMDVQKPRTVANFALNIARYNLPKDFYENYIKNIKAVTLDDVQNAAIKYFEADKARIIVTGKGIDVLNNLEKTDYVIKYFDKEGNPTEKPEMTLPIPEGVTAETVIDKYVDAIGGKDKVAAVTSVMMTSTAKVQGIEVTSVDKMAAPNKMSKVISGMGQVFQKVIFDGESGYQEARGQKMDMTADQIKEIKASSLPFVDMNYKTGKLDRIEPIEGVNYYVIKSGETEIFYDTKTGLKYQEVKTMKGPNGDVSVPTIFGEYKEVNGILFPYAIAQKMGPMDLNFEIKEIKINEGVSEADFK